VEFDHTAAAGIIRSDRKVEQAMRFPS
jgi:hypothetical protein